MQVILPRHLFYRAWIAVAAIIALWSMWHLAAWSLARDASYPRMEAEIVLQGDRRSPEALDWAASGRATDEFRLWLYGVEPRPEVSR